MDGKSVGSKVERMNGLADVERLGLSFGRNMILVVGPHQKQKIFVSEKAWQN